MLQRIQTVFLIIVALAMGAMLLLPIWMKVDVATGETHQLSALYYKSISATGDAPKYVYLPFSIVGILAMAALTVAITEITRYNNRLLQMKLGALNSLFMAGALGLSVWFCTQGQKDWLPEIQGQFQVGLFAPAVAMICNIMANRFIRRDDKLVKSVDRIR